MIYLQRANRVPARISMLGVVGTFSSSTIAAVNTLDEVQNEYEVNEIGLDRHR